MTAGAIAWDRGYHIRMEIVHGRLGTRWRSAADALSALAGVVFFALLSAQALSFAHYMFMTGETGEDLSVALWPFMVFIGVCGTVLCARLVAHGGLAQDLYQGLRKWVDRVPGGLAISSVFACGGFGAITGSSIATVATMGTIVMPEMRRYGYDTRLATGALAASGTLGILIPPSLIFIFYGVMTETSIGALFVAGIFTPTEAASIGCAGVALIAGLRRRLNLTAIVAALRGTALISTMIFSIIVSGYMVARFLAVTGLTDALVELITAAQLGRVGFLLTLVALYFVLGAMLDVLGMLVLTIPFVFPLVGELGVDPVWFGVFVVVMAELALITPPIGANVAPIS